MTYAHSLSEIGKIIPEFTDDIIPLQYTGLKDKNGKEIYEGDVVEHYETLYPVKSKVEWGGQFEECGFVLTGITPFANKRVQYSNDQLNKRWENNLEVIGNIYQNPELLTQS